MNTHNDEQVAKEWLQSLDDYMKEGDQTNQIITQNIGKKVCSAITNFKLGNYSSVVSVFFFFFFFFLCHFHFDFNF